MTTIGPGIVVGGDRVTVAGTVQVGDRTSAGPGVIVTPGKPSDLDSLSDVDAPPDRPGLLERQNDGRVRPIARGDVLAPHVAATEPHPAYDDLPSLRLLFENGLI